MNMEQACTIVMNIERCLYPDEAKLEACKKISEVKPTSNTILKKRDYYHALKWLAAHTELRKNEKLKPCPSCGSAAIIVEDIPWHKAYYVTCGNSKCKWFMGMGSPLWCKSEKEAIEDWNWRVDHEIRNSGKAAEEKL